MTDFVTTHVANRHHITVRTEIHHRQTAVTLPGDSAYIRYAQYALRVYKGKNTVFAKNF